MNALDRYLKAIKPFLPRTRRNEILREISTALSARMEAREAELGRPLTEADRETILERHGSPLLVAGRYRQHDRRLAIGREWIGPALFPHYVKWLSIPIAITCVLFAAALLAGKRPTLGQFLFPVAIQFACVTLIFIVAQVGEAKYGWLGRWRPASPPPAELLRRYLHAVRFWLPKGQQEDILAELAEDLRSKIDDAEADLGRQLNEGELSSILKQRGAPMSVATGYLPPQYLIGPVLFPVYRFVAKLLVLWILLPIYLLAIGPILVRTAAHPFLSAVQALWSFFLSALLSVGVITAVFALIERRPKRDASDWDPRRLPPVPASNPWTDPAPLSRHGAIANILLSALYGLVWIYLAQVRWSYDFGGVRIALVPVWRSVFWAVLAVLLGRSLVGAAALLRPQSLKLHAAIRLAADALSLAVIGILLNAHSWVEITAAGSPLAGIEDAAKWTNLVLWIALLAAAVATIAETVRDVRRLLHKDAASNRLAQTH